MPNRSVGLVLVVDDTLANRWVLARVLEEGGFKVVQGENAAEGLRQPVQVIAASVAKLRQLGGPLAGAGGASS